MTTPITNNTNPTINNEPETVPPMAVEPEAAADAEVDTYVSGEADLFELPPVYSDINGDVDENPATISTSGGSTIQELANPEPEGDSLPVSVHQFINNPRLDAEDYVDEMHSVDGTQVALQDLDSNELKTLVDNQGQFETDAYNAFKARPDFTDDQAADAAKLLRERMVDTYPHRLEDDSYKIVQKAADHRHAQIAETAGQTDLRDDIYNIAVKNRGHRLEGALVEAGVDHDTAPELAKELNGLNLKELRELRDGESGDKKFFIAGEGKYESIENSFRGGLTESQRRLDSLKTDASTSQMRGRLGQDPLYSGANGEARAGHDSVAAQAAVKAHDVEAKQYQAAENYLQDVAMSKSGGNWFSKTLGKAVDVVAAEDEHNMAQTSFSLGLTDANYFDKTAKAEEKADQAWADHFNPVENAKSYVKSKVEGRIKEAALNRIMGR